MNGHASLGGKFSISSFWKNVKYSTSYQCLSSAPRQRPHASAQFHWFCWISVSPAVYKTVNLEKLHAWLILCVLYFEIVNLYEKLTCISDTTFLCKHLKIKTVHVHVYSTHMYLKSLQLALSILWNACLMKCRYDWYV